MISVSTARRRAEEFAALVDGESRSGSSRHADLLDVVTVLREVPPVEARAEFVADLRARLMAEADTALVATDARLSLPAHTGARRDRKFAIAAGAAVVVAATSSMAVAAQNALPGDALYPIKRALESAETSLKVDDTERASQMLDNAAGRLQEAEALALRDNAESHAALPETLDEFVTESNQAADILIEEYDESGDPAPITELRDFAEDSLQLLAELNAVVPTDMRDVVAWAAQQLAVIDQRAQQICPLCAGGITEFPSNLVNARPQVATTSIAPQLVLEPAAEKPDPTLVNEVVGDLQDITSGGTDGSTTDGDQAKTDDKATDEVEDPVKEITDDVLGNEEQGPLGGSLDTLLDPLLGEGGLLNP